MSEGADRLLQKDLAQMLCNVDNVDSNLTLRHEAPF